MFRVLYSKFRHSLGRICLLLLTLLLALLFFNIAFQLYLQTGESIRKIEEKTTTIADIFNGLMAIPNMIALLALSGVVAKETKDFLKRLGENGGHEEGMVPYVNDPTTWKSGSPE